MIRTKQSKPFDLGLAFFLFLRQVRMRGLQNKRLCSSVGLLQGILTHAIINFLDIPQDLPTLLGGSVLSLGPGLVTSTSPSFFSMFRYTPAVLKFKFDW
jgi:hypothetical protein